MENVTLVAMDNKLPSASSSGAGGYMRGAPTPDPDLPRKLLAAGVAACVGDLVTFPLDVAKVRLQIQGEALGMQGAAGVAYATNAAAHARAGGVHAVAFHTASSRSAATSRAAAASRYRGVLGTMVTISRVEGPRALYNGLVPGLQRQMAFASIRIGLYDSVKQQYALALGSGGVAVRIAAGVTTGGVAVLAAQPTDVVKVRLQAARPGAGEARYPGTLAAYRAIARHEGVAGLWKGTSPNIARTTIVNACELVTYDVIKERLLALRLLRDAMPCHVVSAFGAGFVTTVVASPVDVIKTRYMNSPPGAYAGIFDCAAKMFSQEGFSAFYKGFMPSFLRLASWNVVMFVCYEQLKLAMAKRRDEEGGDAAEGPGRRRVLSAA